MTDRTTRYLVRLDAALATLPNDMERRKFCDREYAKWDERYKQFKWDAEHNPSNIPSHDPPTAFDFMMTMSDLGIRQIRYGAEVMS